MYKELAWVAGPALLLVVCALAWFKGSSAERYGSLLILCLNLAGDIVLALSFPRFPGFTLASLDFILAAGLLVLAVRYSSVWLGVAMLLQSVSLCSHAFLFEGLGLNPNQRVELNNAVSNLMLACIIAGTFVSSHTRRKRLMEAASGLTSPT